MVAEEVRLRTRSRDRRKASIWNSACGSVVPTVGALVMGSRKLRYPCSVSAMKRRNASWMFSSRAC